MLLNEDGTHLALIGRGGVTVMQLPEHRGKFGLFEGGKAKILCRSVLPILYGMKVQRSYVPPSPRREHQAPGSHPSRFRPEKGGENADNLVQIPGHISAPVNSLNSAVQNFEWLERYE